MVSETKDALKNFGAWIVLVLFFTGITAFCVLVLGGCHSGARIELGFMGASVALQFQGPDVSTSKPTVTVQAPPPSNTAAPGAAQDDKGQTRPPELAPGERRGGGE